MNRIWQKALGIVKNDGVLVFPTDTVMGVGCSMASIPAIKKLYEAKQRPSTQATAVLVSGIEMAKKLMRHDPDERLKDILTQHWPGALTVVVEASDIVPKEILGGTNNVGIRIPDHKELLELIVNLDCPLVATSANTKGGETPVKFSNIEEDFLGAVDYLVEEDALGSTASTVIRYLGDGKVEYLRKGEIVIET